MWFKNFFLINAKFATFNTWSHSPKSEPIKNWAGSGLSAIPVLLNKHAGEKAAQIDFIHKML